DRPRGARAAALARAGRLSCHDRGAPLAHAARGQRARCRGDSAGVAGIWHASEGRMTGTTTGRLFHAIVAMGVALTGGVPAGGGGTSGGEQDAAATDGCSSGSKGCDDAYAHIAYNGDANAGDAYVGISIAPDTGTDGYPQIGIDTGIQDAPPDCYPCIAP